MLVLTRLITLIATAVLAVAVLFRSAPDYRMAVCVIVSVAAVTIVVRSLSTGKIVWAVLFLGVLGIFTPFRNSQFSNVHVSVLNLAALALFAASPIMLRRSTTAVVSSASPGKL
ncbi:MAG TPA: hypothetical protein VJ999_08460 [Candidatus Sulfotelmatobacter sp.]|nr:hypothetical protein [Candidatus Sulfotelmatobacter sp.]